MRIKYFQRNAVTDDAWRNSRDGDKDSHCVSSGWGRGTPVATRVAKRICYGVDSFRTEDEGQEEAKEEK